ncbi:MAG: flavin-dependent oxidoreductase [Pseudomonadota bacterium]
MDGVIIAGGGIGGLTLALTLHQIGVPVRVFEAAREMKPLGVGINVQPNAVREFFDLGIDREALDAVGLPIREWALLGLNGKQVHAEPRGTEAGYHWPQYAVHRGALHMLLYQTVVERLGAGTVQLGARVERYETDGTKVSVRIRDRTGQAETVRGDVLIGADGIHSAVRLQMYPDQPKVHWGGAIMWRGTVRARPLRGGASFVGLGSHRRRMVIYPISKPDADGAAWINWIAEQTTDTPGDWPDGRWFRPVDVAEFAHHFRAFSYDWLNVPDMLERADCAYENPMIDRDPVPSWVDGLVGLMGDAAHAMYPTGSNGASQAIVDARVIGAKMLEHGVKAAALAAYDRELCAPISELVLRNRSAGPFGLLDLLDARCGGVFDDIETVLPEAERQAFLAEYKSAAGFAVQALNAAPPIIREGATIA